MEKILFYLLLTIVILLFVYFGSIYYQKTTSKIYMNENLLKENLKMQELDKKVESGELQKLILAGGCFWCTEASFNPEFGVVEAVSGYFGGSFPNPTYEDVSGHKTDHREVVNVYFNPASTSLKRILVNYWHDIDPTQADGQFHDIGHQYTPAIYYFNEDQKILANESKKILEESKKFGDKKIAVEILDGQGLTFYPAEEYHQDYAAKNPVRYEYFKKGSGRADFVKANWAHDKTFENFLKESTSLQKSDKPWMNFNNDKKEKRLSELSPLQIKVTQHEGTEPPVANEYDKNYAQGIYVDIVSGEPLYLSKDKYDSGTGWPSFVKPIDLDVITTKTDNYLIYSRTEVRSKIANSHLGHVFDDGPKDRGGKRYCMNSAALRFIPLEKMEEEGYGEYIKDLN